MRLSLVLPLLFAFGVPPGRADDWPRWRGPDGNSVSAGAPLPVTWGATTNVRWKVAVCRVGGGRVGPPPARTPATTSCSTAKWSSTSNHGR